jgi:uncharacterized protein DUF4374
MRLRLLKLSAGALLIGSLGGCLVDDKKDDKKTGTGDYVIGITSQSEEGADYLMTASSIASDTLSPLGRGIEQTGWRYLGFTNNIFYSAGYFTDNNFIAYTKNAEQKLVEKGRFTFQTTLDQFGEVSATELLAMEIPRKGFNDRVFHRINLENVSIAQKVSTPIYENRADSLSAQPTSLVYRDGKVYVSFYQIHANGTFNTPNTDTAFVAIYSYPGLTLDKVIKDPRSGPFGMYGNSNGLIKTASNDLYGHACASRACFTSDSDVTHSKILRIKSGETEFDPGYEFDFEQATGSKLTWFAHVGGELAIGRGQAVSALEAAGDADTTIDWQGLGGDYQKLYIIDLAGKTATEVSGVPAHSGQYGTPWLVEDGVVHMCIITAEPASANIYGIDIASKKGVKGAAIKGAEVKLIAKNL